MNQRLKGFIPDCSGSMAVSVVLILVVILGIAAVAVDYGHLTWVSSELRKGAEGGALAGAKALVPYTGTPLQPNWNQALTTATRIVLLNRADAQFLTDCEVVPGYWNLSTKTLDQNTGKTPGATEVPAVRVGIAKSTGHNGGPLRMLFAPIFRVNTLNLGAQAMAMLSFPVGMPAGTVFPLAAAQTIVNQYWNNNPPVSFKIGAGFSNGQWTSFKIDSSSASDIAGLISGCNPTPLNLQDSIYIQTGVEASNYGNAGSAVGKTVVIALVNADMTRNSSTPILGFVAFKIEAVSQGSKYIQGHFDKDFNITTAGLVGPPTPDTLSNPNPPKLVY